VSLNGIAASAISALKTNSAALGVVANNVSNLNTPGYARRIVNQQTLSAGGQLMGAADNARQAIHELQDLNPHLILIDLVLAGGSGFEVLDAIQTGGAGRGAVGVVFTNHVSTEDRERSFLLGASYFFDKSTQGRQALHLITKMAAERGGGTSTRADPGRPNG